jgi:hypothetical protein
MTEVPAISMLLLDTSAQSLSAVTRGNDATSLGPNEILELPLRRPQDYRSHSEKFLRWLGRRWLYNIPRSLKTEGLRPLGRLAFVDHSKEVYSRLRQNMSAAADSKAIDASRQRSGLDFQTGSLRVYVVASISGGTGGGIAIDLAYAAQLVRDQLNLSDAGVLGILMHFTTANPRHREVGLINTFSWLKEYDHYCRPNGQYPGDSSCGLPAQGPNKKPFDHTYLTHIGDGLNDEDLIQAAGTVADYIYLDLLTPAGAYIDACRKAPCELPPFVARQAPLRTFGLSRTSVVQHDLLDDAVCAVAGDAVSGWLGRATQSANSGRPGPTHPAPRGDAAGPDKSDEIVRALGEAVNLEALKQNAARLLHDELRSDPQDYFKCLLAEVGSSSSATWNDVIRAIDAQFGIAENLRDYVEMPGTVLSRPVRAITRPCSAKLAGTIQHAVLRLVDDLRHRLPGAKQTLLAIRERVRGLDMEADRMLASAREKRIAFYETSRLSTKRPALESAPRPPNRLCNTSCGRVMRQSLNLPRP